jgi:hypothetical protein
MAPLRNPRHEIFAQHVAAGVPATEAMALAGFKKPLASNARRLRNMPHVRERIEALWADAARLCGVTIGRTLLELTRIAYSRLPDLFEAAPEGDGIKVRDITKLPAELASAIREIKIGNDGAVIVKMHDKVGALAALQKYTERMLEPPPAVAEASRQPAFEAADEWTELVDRPQPLRIN